MITETRFATQAVKRDVRQDACEVFRMTAASIRITNSVSNKPIATPGMSVGDPWNKGASEKSASTGLGDARNTPNPASDNTAILIFLFNRLPREDCYIYDTIN